ncbi:MAG: ABC transporter ATP-binding protein [Promethearchaeota archaeon]
MILIYLFGRNWSEIVKNFLIAQTKVNSTIIEYIQGIAAIKAFNQTTESFQKYQKNMAMWRNNLVKWSKKTALLFTLFEAFISSTLIVILPVGIWLYNNGTLTKEIFLFFLLIGPIFSGLFTRIYQFLNYYIEEECVKRVNKLRNAPIIIDSKEDRIPSCFDITFKNVNFSYEGKEKDVLRDISFNIPQGSICALVGPSGAGKTTITRLIPRFWDVEKGEILIGEHDIRKLPLNRLLSFISPVFQEVFLFNDTIMENIRLGRKNATNEEVISVAKIANCQEFINDLPNGYNTIIGERGMKLSGGERQRISIARAILKNSPILILDEATVYIDPENENLIQEAINKLIKNKTVLIIAHRLSIVKSVDKILVLDQGKIVERGNHQELIAMGGLYRKLWDDHKEARGWKF